MIKSIILNIIFYLLIIPASIAKDFYVSPKGKDTNVGSKNYPFLTVERAKLAVQKEIEKGLTEDMQVYLMEGTYILDETVVFGLQDSPSGEFTVTYQSFKNKEVIISSGHAVGIWSKAVMVDGMPAKSLGNVWVAEMPVGIETFRTLFDGDKMLTRARSADFKMPLKKEIKRADSQNTFYHKDRIHLRMVPYPNDEIKN